MSVCFFGGVCVICSVGWGSRKILVKEMLDPWGGFMCVCVCVCVSEWGVELNFRVHSSQGGELGGKGKGKGKRDYSLLGTVVLCLYKCTCLARSLQVRDESRNKKSPSRISSFSPYLPPNR